MNTRKEQFKKEFAMRLTARMECLNLDQKSLAKLAEIAPSMVCRYMSAMSVPRADTLARLALALGVSADELISF